MKEFGSDFHFLSSFNTDCVWLNDTFPQAHLLADGRLCILALIKQYRWKRIWMPEYFCYNIIEYLRIQTGIEVVFYVDYPGNDDEKIISALSFKDGDVLLRMNYFGLRSFRSEKCVPIPVIEDHSHDIIGDWAINSDADWCIASLRKIIPIPEGGILWSPKGLSFDTNLNQTLSNSELSRKRWKAMEMKGGYLKGDIREKELFRTLFLETEDAFDNLELSLIDEKSKYYIEHFDIFNWYNAKRRNWDILRKLESNKGIEVILPEFENLNPFSFIVLFENEEKKERIRRKLIESSIYPAVLWNVPCDAHDVVQYFSKRMLSIHCDGRYTEKDVEELYNKINLIIQND